MDDITITSKDFSDEAKKEFQAAIERALAKCGAVAQNFSSNLVPVQTGRLKSSITFGTETVDYAGFHPAENGAGLVPNGLAEKPQENQMILGSNVSYAGAIELGTWKQKAQPYLRPAIENHRDTYNKIIENELKALEK